MLSRLDREGKWVETPLKLAMGFTWQIVMNNVSR